MSVASVIARGNSFYRSVPGFGSEREEKVAPMAVGDYLGAFAMSEPGAGSDMAAVSCRAVRARDDWIINGNKYWCTFGDGADFISVVCRIDSDGGSRQAGMKSIPVEKPRGELPKGVQGSPIPKIGYHGWKTWELHFDNVRIPSIDPPLIRRWKRVERKVWMVFLSVSSKVWRCAEHIRRHDPSAPPRVQ
jgi:alkylation response protein AidB-like acyl-CoA dehydrogenase